MLLKISSVIFVFLSSVAFADQPVWVGSKAELSSATSHGSNVDIARRPQKGRLNLRATARMNEIEVYNWNKGAWIKSGIAKIDKIKLNDPVVNTLTNLSECDHIADVLFEIRESTPTADVYADGFTKGQTDSNGMYKQKVRTVCLNDNCRFELKKSACESVAESFSVTSNPFTYTFNKKLTCK
ncbi:MAG: hypothetical protein IPJ71_04480 [Bdellovibrionales bacterium]|nr:hypothetical protein [Bdellovibrionales bacterium]